MYFPITCVDNFYNRPDKVVKLAKTLPFIKTDGHWPGKRSPLLSDICPDFFNAFGNKLFNLFYNSKHNHNLPTWTILTTFQMIEPGDFLGDVLPGFIHKDYGAVQAGIIYLNQEEEPEAGTSIYRAKEIGTISTNHDEIKKEIYLNYKKENREEYLKHLNENNFKFEETITFKNVYNRLITYPGDTFHGVKFYGNKPRLTQVFFITEVLSDWYPITNMRRVDL